MKLSRMLSGAILAAAILLIGLNASLAAKLDDIHTTRNVGELNRKHGPTRGALNAQARADRYKEILSLEAESTLVMIKSSEQKTANHYRFQQQFQGVPVYGATIKISEDLGGNLRSLFGHIAQDLARDLTSTAANLTPQQALSIAKRAALIGPNAGVPTENETSEKVIYIGDDGVARVAYKAAFSIAAPTEPSAPVFMIDANTGEILGQWDSMVHANATGPGGNPKTGQYEYGTTPGRGYLNVTQVGTVCTMENTKSRTVDLNNGTTGSAAFSFTCPRNTVRVANEAYSPLNDAHYYGSITHDMFMSYMGEAPWESKIVLRAHYGTNFWAAYDPQGVLVNIGDGDTTAYPNAVLDVVAHEIAHGYTVRVEGVAYNNGQWGAMNESFSDMAGEAAEFYMLGTNNFEVGRAAIKGTGAIRYMCNPTTITGHIAHASNYVTNMPVHQAAGVYNKAFCTLAKKPNWTTKKAFQVFAKANDDYWGNFTGFNVGACGVELAATDLGYSKADVTAALSSVGVSCGIIWDESSAVALYGGPPPDFSNGNKTVEIGTEPPSGHYGYSVEGTVAKSAGKRYLEFKMTKLDYGTVCQGCSDFFLTLRVAGSTGAYPENDWGLGFHWYGMTPTNDQFLPSLVVPPYDYVNSNIPTWDVHEGDIIGLAVDLTTGKVWFSHNGVWSGNPAAGTGPVFDQSTYGAAQQISGKSIVPGAYAAFAEFDVTIRGSAAEFTNPAYPIPSGFVPWTNP